MYQKLLIFGAGGHGKVVADIACDMCRWDEIGFVDDQYPELRRLGLWEVLGRPKDIEKLHERFESIVVAIGDSRVRVGWLRQCVNLGFEIPVIQHPKAAVSRLAEIGCGSVVVAQAAINAGAVVGMGGIVNTGATVGHDCKLGEGVHVAPGANLAGGVTVGADSWIGIGAKVIQNVTIGKNVMVGAGSVVLRDIEDGVTVVGNPARVISGERA